MYAVSPQGQVKWTFDFGQHLGPTPLLTSDQSGPGGAANNGIGSGASPTIGSDGPSLLARTTATCTPLRPTAV